MFWLPGQGKTCGAIASAQTFIPLVIKYKTKITIIVPGRLHKEMWKNDIIKCTGDTYLKDLSQQLGYVSEEDKEQAMKQAKNTVSQYYRIMSHVGLYKRVLGQRVIEHVKGDGSDNPYNNVTQG